MSSSGEAIAFFSEWRNAKTKLSFVAVLEGVCFSGMGRLTVVEGNSLVLSDKAARLALVIPLEGCTFEASDPERGSGVESLDEIARELGFRFGWEIVLPSTDRILLAVIENETT